MRTTTYLRRLDGQMVNLAVGQTLSVPTDFIPTRTWFYKHALRWRKRIPGFKIKTSRLPGDEWFRVTRIS